MVQRGRRGERRLSWDGRQSRTTRMCAARCGAGRRTWEQWYTLEENMNVNGRVLLSLATLVRYLRVTHSGRERGAMSKIASKEY